MAAAAGNSMMKSWFKRHLQVLFYTLGHFSRNRLSVSMTVLALGIGFSIPIIMYSVVDSLTSIGGQWQERPQITLYLDKSADSAQIESIRLRLNNDLRFSHVQYISAEQGLAEFSINNQFEQAIALLDHNPLPPVFVVFPHISHDPDDIAALTNELGQIEYVASAQYDFEWLQKLSALTSFLKRTVIVLASIIAIGLLLLIANTIRLEISNRKNEIEIIDQLGGTPAFIARPFLYMGFLEGFLGGIVAIAISAMILQLLHGPLLKLADLYSLAFTLPRSRLDIVIIVLGSSGLLGWLSAKFTLSQYMRELTPT